MERNTVHTLAGDRHDWTTLERGVESIIPANPDEEYATRTGPLTSGRPRTRAASRPQQGTQTRNRTRNTNGNGGYWNGEL